MPAGRGTVAGDTAAGCYVVPVCPLEPSRGRGSSRYRRRYACALLFLLVCAGTAHAKSLHVDCADPGRAIWINGTFFGTDEVFVDSLLTETVIVRVGEPLYSSAWIHPWQVILAASDGAEFELHLPALQRLTLRSPVQSVRVQLEGRDVGRTPLTLLVPRHESVRLSVAAELDAPLPFSRDWNYQPRGLRDSTLSLGPTLPVSMVLKVPKSHVWRARSRYLLPLAAVVSGVVGVWARQTADRSYDNYLDTVDLDRLETEYDRAARYDRFAIGCWAAAEALLVTSVWTWLRGDPEEPIRSAEGP